MNRVTQKDLDLACQRLNTVTGCPLSPYSSTPRTGYYLVDGRTDLYVGVGSYLVEGTRLYRVKRCTGQTAILVGQTKQELLYLIHAYLQGYDCAYYQF
jgi:hypothetical protein